MAKASPNYESGYEGNSKQLREYAVRIDKMIDDCGTIQKSEYLVNLTRAIINGLIDTNKYFKLCNCVLNLTEEDLLFLQNDIGEKVINDDKEYIDDFRSVGILYEVNGGYAYSRRAYDLKQYALLYNYDENINRPAIFLARVKPISIEITDDQEIDNLFDGGKDSE